MTAQSSIPLKWYVPFANNDSSRVELPVTTSDPTRASQSLGFPPLTMQPPESGGVPPQGEDFNGGMNQVARICWWLLNGGGYPFDSIFAANSNINGYPNGATLQSADFLGQWISIADNNQNNPDVSGASWVPGFQYGITNLTGLTGGTVTPTPAQAAKRAITLAGTLTSALTIILPTWLKDWTITNGTSGAFVTIVKTAAGSGITIPQNAQPTRVSGDGTNIVQASENIAAAAQNTNAAQFGQVNPGRLLNIQVFTSSGTYTPTAGTTKIKIRCQAGGGGGGGTPATGAGQVATAGGGGAGSFAEGLYANTIAQTVTVGIGGLASGASASPGGTGGTSSVGSLISAAGGIGGGAGSIVTPPAIVGVLGAAGAQPTLGNIVNTRGAPGTSGIMLAATNAISGAGGNSVLGGGAASQSNAAGTNGNGYGGGASGACAFASAPATTGGTGAPGIVIIEEYA